MQWAAEATSGGETPETREKHIKQVRDSLSRMNNRVTLAVFLLLSAAAAYGGPFGTFDSMPWPARTVYWTLIVGVSIFMGYLTRGVSVALLPANRPILVDLFATLLMTLLFTPVVWGLTAIFGDPSSPDFPSLFRLMSYVAPVTLIVFISRRVLPGVEDLGYFEPLPSSECPRLLNRLETREGRILRLSSRDHFVDVVFADRTETLRMRFRDAVSEMEPVTGTYVHRSHWVADGAVEQAERADGRLWLILNNGDRVPVSRGYRAEVEAHGWV